jgi:hypothetical protein
MENRETVIEKIPINKFIDVLVDLYNKGVDYIDIIAEKGERQDRMAISFTSEYMTPEGVKYFEKDDPFIEVEGNPSLNKLSDEDLNQLA